MGSAINIRAMPEAARALERGLDRARVWVGDHGRWKALIGRNEDFRKAPSFDARAEVVKDDALLDALLARFEEKYPAEIANWRDKMRSGYHDGSRVLIGSEARIVLDAAPDYVIPARVSFVAAEAQFTPREVETRSEREKLMFRLKVKIDPELLRLHKEKVKTGLPGEAFVRLGSDGDWPERLAVAWDAEPLPPPTPRGYPVPRAHTHAWFLVTGEHGTAMFAKICGVDLRPQRFDKGQVAQTSVARLTGTVIRDDRGGVPAFHLLADSASAAYLWDCLLDAMAEFAGAPVGLTAVRGLT